MKRIAVGDANPEVVGDGVERRRLSDRLGTTGVAVNRYRVPPGEGLSGGLHAHADQEEVFVVLAGRATFATLDGEVTVAAGGAIRFAPGEFQSGRNDADRELVVLALGAPRDSEDVRLPVACPACGRGSLRVESGGGGAAFVCPDCGTRRGPRPCPECGDGDLRVAPGEAGGTVAVCQGCGTAFDEPPMRDPD